MALRLSPHFTLEEFTRSQTAARLHIDNTPSNLEISRLSVLCIYLLEPLREYVQHAIIITSGYRCAALNKAVGGAKDSYHVKGMAADIRIEGEKSAEVAAKFLCKQHCCDQVIFERCGKSMWLHIGWSYAPRHQFLKIIK